MNNFTCFGTTICLSQGMLRMKRDPRKESEDHFAIQEVMRGADPFGSGPDLSHYTIWSTFLELGTIYYCGGMLIKQLVS
jgi:hypothetical protein